MKIIKIDTREKYDKLKHLTFNRDYKVRTDLMEAMNEFGYVVPAIIIKTDLITGKTEQFIADGQNRLITAIHLGIPAYGAIVDREFKTTEEIVKFVANLNSKHKVWKNDDYVTAFAYLQFPHYLKLQKITQLSPYSLSTIATMLIGFRSSGKVSGKLKNGTFKILLEKETYYTLRIAKNLSKIGKLSSRMILALHYVASLKSFNEEKFTKKYEEQYNCIKELKLDDYTDIFESWL